MKNSVRSLLVGLLLLVFLGCSDSRFDYGPPVGPRMSIRVQGKTKKRIEYYLREYQIEDSGSSSSWQSGNSQVSKSTGERFEVPLETATDGFTFRMVAPFDDKITLEVVQAGKVVESKTSTKAGTVLLIEFGTLPKDRDLSFSDQSDADVESFRKSLLKAIQAGNLEAIEGVTFANETILKQCGDFTAALKERYGQPQETGSDYWIPVPVEGSQMIQGALSFGKKDVPMIFGTRDTEAGRVIEFIVVEFVPEGRWTPIEQWQEQIAEMK